VNESAATARITNPLGLEVEWRASVAPLHEPTDPAKVEALLADMTWRGWDGPPIVADGELRDAGQDRAFTGAHRLEAWSRARGEWGPEVPCVYVEDLAGECGADWGELMAKHGNDTYGAATELCGLLPEDIRDAYGFDVGGL
jgi:hypothetical protein